MENNILLMNGKKFHFSITPGNFRRLFPEFHGSFGGESQRFWLEDCKLDGKSFSASVRFWRGQLRDIHFKPQRSEQQADDWYRKVCDEWLYSWLGPPDEQNKDTTYYKRPWGYAAAEYESANGPECFVVIGFKR